MQLEQLTTRATKYLTRVVNGATRECNTGTFLKVDIQGEVNSVYYKFLVKIFFLSTLLKHYLDVL